MIVNLGGDIWSFFQLPTMESTGLAILRADDCYGRIFSRDFIFCLWILRRQLLYNIYLRFLYFSYSSISRVRAANIVIHMFDAYFIRKTHCIKLFPEVCVFLKLTVDEKSLIMSTFTFWIYVFNTEAVFWMRIHPECPFE